MFFSKMTFNTTNLPYESIGNEYFVHQMIWMAFSDNQDRKRDFLYRIEHSDKPPVVYAVSERSPFQSTRFWSIETKKYQPQIFIGLQLGFQLRANPTFKREGKRHDVVMDNKINIKKEAGNKSNTRISEIMYTAGQEWLTSKSIKNGFQVCQLRVDGYRQHRLYKNNGRQEIKYSTIDFTGILTVVDKELFLKSLFQGVGPAKGFGCGLLMVKRI